MATRVIGVEKLKRKLTAIPARSKPEIRKAIAKSANEIVAMMRRLVPKDTGALRDSIGWTWGSAPIDAVFFADTGGSDPELLATIFAGNDKAYYARWVEFGTQAGVLGGRVQNNRKGSVSSLYTRKVYRSHPGTNAQPFFFPSFRANRKTAKARIKRAVTKAAKAEAI